MYFSESSQNLDLTGLILQSWTISIPHEVYSQVKIPHSLQSLWRSWFTEWDSCGGSTTTKPLSVVFQLKDHNSVLFQQLTPYCVLLSLHSLFHSQFSLMKGNPDLFNTVYKIPDHDLWINVNGVNIKSRYPATVAINSTMNWEARKFLLIIPIHMPAVIWSRWVLLSSFQLVTAFFALRLQLGLTFWTGMPLSMHLCPWNIQTRFVSISPRQTNRRLFCLFWHCIV